MRTWARAALTSAVEVSDRPLRWLPGALAWIVTAGWITFVLGVARQPTMAELTFLGARFYTSGAWPWNLVAVLGGIVCVAGVALALAAAAEATLIRRGPPSTADVRRVFAVSVVCVVPVLAALGLVGIGMAAVAPALVNAPGDGGGPLARIALRVLPLLVATALVIVACGAWHAAASRSVLAGGSVPSALAGAPRVLARGGAASLLQALGGLALRVGSIAFGATLLRVLWAPIEQRLALDGIGVAAALLLVGFVAIWLCLVLAGGALHAWGTATWTRLLAPGVRDDMEAPTEA